MGILFTPGLAGREEQGLADHVFTTIRKSDINVQKDYLSHILLSGGNTSFPGFSTRLQKDIRQLYLDQVLKGDRSRAKNYRCCVEDPPRRQQIVFYGGCIMAKAHPNLKSSWWISRAEYAEAGAAAVHRLIATKLS